MKNYLKRAVLSGILISATGFYSNAQSTSPNYGTGEMISMILHTDNCLGGLEDNLVGGDPGGDIGDAMKKYGPIRICFPNQDVLNFSMNPQVADQNSNFIIIKSNQVNHIGVVTEGETFFIIAHKSGMNQHPGLTRSQVFTELYNGIEIVKGVSPEIDEAQPVDSGNAGWE